MTGKSRTSMMLVCGFFHVMCAIDARDVMNCCAMDSRLSYQCVVHRWLDYRIEEGFETHPQSG